MWLRLTLQPVEIKTDSKENLSVFQKHARMSVCYNPGYKRWIWENYHEPTFLAIVIPILSAATSSKGPLQVEYNMRSLMEHL